MTNFYPNTEHLADDTPCSCDNCDWKGALTETNIIADAELRLEPGSLMPAGECPECGCLAHIVQEPKSRDFNPRIWSFLIAWHYKEPGQGTYGWSGEAESREAALELAFAEMAESQDEGWTSINSTVTEEWHGTNPWAELDVQTKPDPIIIEALEASRDALQIALTEHIYNADEGEKPDADCRFVATLNKVEAAIELANKALE